MTAKRDIPSDIKESAHKIWLAGLGALSAAEEEGSKIFKTLVERGENFENRGRVRYDEVKDSVKDSVDNATGEAKQRVGGAWDKVEERLDDAVTAALGRLGVPSRDEIATLTRRVEELTSVVEQLKPAKKTASRSRAKSTTKSTAAKSAAKSDAN
ncbi:MAG: phasin family protein [Acidobacteriota bacterium]